MGNNLSSQSRQEERYVEHGHGHRPTSGRRNGHHRRNDAPPTGRRNNRDEERPRRHPAQQPQQQQQPRPQQPQEPQPPRAQQPRGPQRSGAQQPREPQPPRAQQPQEPQRSRAQQPRGPQRSGAHQPREPQPPRPQQAQEPQRPRPQQPQEPQPPRAQQPREPQRSRAQQPREPQRSGAQQPREPQRSGAQQPRVSLIANSRFPMPREPVPPRAELSEDGRPLPYNCEQRIQIQMMQPSGPQNPPPPPRPVQYPPPWRYRPQPPPYDPLDPTVNVNPLKIKSRKPRVSKAERNAKFWKSPTKHLTYLDMKVYPVIWPNGLWQEGMDGECESPESFPSFLKQHLTQNLRLFIKFEGCTHCAGGLSGYPEARYLFRNFRYLKVNFRRHHLDGRARVDIEEHHGIKRMRTKPRRRKMYPRNIIMDHVNQAVIITGADFLLSLQRPNPLLGSLHFPDGNGEIPKLTGTYTREMDTSPNIVFEWNVSLYQWFNKTDHFDLKIDKLLV